MSEESRDLMVIGGGPGGYLAAIRASQLGRKVTLIERDELGGTCLNWGCIPSKALLKSAEVYHQFKDGARFGVEADNIRVDYPRIIERSREVAATLRRGVSFLMKKNRIEIIKGTAKLEPGRKISLEAGGLTKNYTFTDVIIAAGARPRTFADVDADGEVLHTSRTILECRRLPQKILIVGAGSVGVEFAHFFNTFGVQVTLVEMLDRILPAGDPDQSLELRKIFEEQGIIIKTQHALKELKRTGKIVTAVLAEKEAAEKWSGDSCLMAAGVIPNCDKLNCEALGISLKNGYIAVDRQMRTNIPNHYAIGDVCGPPLLAHKASHEGMVAAEAACGNENTQMDYANIPACTYCRPQAASIGMTEPQVKQAGIPYLAGKIPFSAIGKAQALGETEGFIKVLIAADTNEILGIHILHAEASELIAEGAVVRSHEGIAASLIDTIHPHPTLTEALAEATAVAMKRPMNF